MGFADTWDDDEGRAPAAAEAAAELAVAESLYRGFTRAYLMELRAAFVVDRARQGDATARAWITGRIDLIDRLLDE